MSNITGEIWAAPAAKAPVPGVVYLSRIPRWMTLDVLTSVFEAAGKLGRVFLRPESTARYNARVAAGARNTRLFEEGWVEFQNKRDAKKAARLMNGQPVGGKKCGNMWRDNLWCVRYLHKFTWEDLKGYKFMHDMARKKKLKSELAAISKQNRFLLEQVAKKQQKRRSGKRDS